MRLLFSSPLAAASLLVVACTGSPAITSQPTPAAPTPAATQAPSTPVPSLVATPSPQPQVEVELLSNDPVLVGDDLDPHATPGYYGATLPATYFTANGTEHMYVVGFGPGYGIQRVFHASSPDGLEWTVDEADPLAAFVDEFSPPGPIPGTVMKDENGDWVMFFWGIPEPLPDGAQIYRATADDPAGPWEMDPEPILPIGATGEIDDLGLDFPSVIQTAAGYLMLYGANGGDRPHTARVLLASSEDGITWEKQGRVIEPQLCGGADSDFIAIPRLFASADGLVALTVMGDDVAALRSGDGLDWTCAADGPVFRAPEIPGNERVHTMAASAAEDGTVRMMIEALFSQNEGEVVSNLWLTEVTGL